MKITYWHYYFNPTHKDNRGRLIVEKSRHIRFDLKTILINFSTRAHISFMQGFMDDSSSEHLVLKESNSKFIFLRTKKEEMLKILNEDFTVRDIESALKNNQSIAAASYFALSECHLVIGATQNGPGIHTLQHFIDLLFNKLKIPLRFVAVPIGAKLNPSEIGNFHRVNSLEVQIPVDGNGSLWSELKNYFNFDGDDIAAIHNLKIGFSVHRGSDFKEGAKKIADRALDESTRFKLKAKREIGAQMLDYFLTEQGQKHSVVKKPSSDSNALLAIAQALSEAVEYQLSEATNHEEAPEDDIYTRFLCADNWAADMGN